MATYGRPDFSRSGTRRDAMAAPVRRALMADSATTAASAELADGLNTVTPRGASIDGSAYLALVVDGRIEPLTVDDFCSYLESRYVLTPTP